jgi:hypothetical protein
LKGRCPHHVPRRHSFAHFGHANRCRDRRPDVLLDPDSPFSMAPLARSLVACVQPDRRAQVLDALLELIVGGVGAGVSPTTALAVGLKVDSEALPASVVAGIQSGQVDLNDPATTVALTKLRRSIVERRARGSLEENLKNVKRRLEEN